MRICMKCANVVNHRADLEFNEQDATVSSRCFDASRFRMHTNETIWSSAERVSAAGLRVGARKDLQKILGINHHPESILLDHGLRHIARPADCIYYDFMHVFVSGGVANREFFLFLERCLQERALSYESVFRQLANWIWPSWVEAPPYKVCNAKHCASSRSARIFKCGASEMLSFYPVFREIVRGIAPQQHEVLNLEIKSLLALFNVLDGFCSAMHGHGARNLGTAVELWLENFTQAYPDEAPLPKHHFALHLAEQIDRGKQFLTCFCF